GRRGARRGRAPPGGRRATPQRPRAGPGQGGGRARGGPPPRRPARRRARADPCPRSCRRDHGPVIGAAVVAAASPRPYMLAVRPRPRNALNLLPQAGPASPTGGRPMQETLLLRRQTHNPAPPPPQV